MTDPISSQRRDADSLAAAFLLHHLNGNREGLHAIAATLNETAEAEFLAAFVSGMAEFALTYGRLAYESDDQFRSELQRMIIALQKADD